MFLSESLDLRMVSGGPSFGLEVKSLLQNETSNGVGPTKGGRPDGCRAAPTASCAHDHAQIASEYPVGIPVSARGLRGVVSYYSLGTSYAALGPWGPVGTAVACHLARGLTH